MTMANIDVANLSSEQVSELKSLEQGFLEKTELKDVALICVKSELKGQ